MVIASFLFFAPNAEVFADERNEPSKETILERPKNDRRPNMPSKVNIVCSYYPGYLEFSFPPEIETMTVTLSEDSVPVWNGMVFVEEPSVDIPLLKGEYTVSCITDRGHIFIGKLTF